MVGFYVLISSNSTLNWWKIDPIAIKKVFNQADFEEWTKFNKLQFHRYRTERILKMFSQVFAELKET